MGLHCSWNRWSIPLRHSHSFPSSFFKLSSYCVVGARNSAVRATEAPGKPTRAGTCSSAGLQALDNDLYETTDGRNSQSGLLDNSKIPSVEENLANYDWSASQGLKSTQLKLIMENLGVLEGYFTGTDATRLEEDILLQLGKLGALRLFKACLFRSLENSLTLDYPEQIKTEDAREPMGNDNDDVHSGKHVVRSGKRETRKSIIQRIEKAKQEKGSTSLQQMQILYFPGDGARNSRVRRQMIRSREGDMAKGIKMLKKLETIRSGLEKETKQVESLSRWAKTSGMDEKTLQQHLHIGWYCRDELIRSTRSLVLFLSRSYRGLGIALEDLLQAGYLGVLQGAERFDDTRGVKFSTYVQYWIRRSMSRMVARDARGIRLPYSLIQVMNKIQKARKSLKNATSHYPDDLEIAKSTGLSLDKVRSASRCFRVVGSIDQNIGESFNIKFMEVTPDTSIRTSEEVVTKQHMRKDISNLLMDLDPRERQILVLRFGLEGYVPWSLEDIGKLFQVSKGWVRIIEKKALSKLQTEETCTILSHYLDF